MSALAAAPGGIHLGNIYTGSDVGLYMAPQRICSCVQKKFFGAHAGILYGKHDLLAKLFAYKVRPATKKIPGKFETETQHHEGIAGVLGAIEYFEWIGKEFGSEYAKGLSKDQGRRLELKKGMAAIHAYDF